MTTNPMQLRGLLFLAAGTLVATSAGCLIMADGERIVRDEEERLPVEFESEQGLIDFQTAVRRRGTPGARYEGEGSFMIPLIIAVDQTRILSQDAFYNDQVRAADVNRDGTLSDAEVTAYVGP